METRAKKVGMGGKLHYIFPSNGGLNPTDTVKAKALGIDKQMAADIHVSELTSSAFHQMVVLSQQLSVKSDFNLHLNGLSCRGLCRSAEAEESRWQWQTSSQRAISRSLP